MEGVHVGVAAVGRRLAEDYAFEGARVVLGRPLAPDLETIVTDVEVALPLRLLRGASKR